VIAVKKTIAVFATAALTAAGTGCYTNAYPHADPGMIQWGNGYHAVSTSGISKGMPVWSADVGNLVNGWSQTSRILYSKPGWVDDTTCGSDCGYWAPQVYYFHSIGKFVAFFASRSTSQWGGYKCIGRAVDPDGNLDNFVPDPTPLLCGSGFSVIGASVFWDPNRSQHYLLYKEDRPGSAKRIMSRMINNDGSALQGPAAELITPTQAWETRINPSVEAPSMVYHPGNNPDIGHYYLFYSGNQYNTDRYGVGVARMKTPMRGAETADPNDNGVTKRAEPDNPILSGNSAGANFCGVGTADFTNDGNTIWYSSYKGQTGDACNDSRWLAVDQVDWVNGWPHVNDGKPSG
jgi:beta-xylosidase